MIFKFLMDEPNGDVEALAEEIYLEFSGQYSAGDRIPVERVFERTKAMAKEYGVCCPPIKVLSFMESQKYLERVQREFRIL